VGAAKDELPIQRSPEASAIASKRCHFHQFIKDDTQFFLLPAEQCTWNRAFREPILLLSKSF